MSEPAVASANLGADQVGHADLAAAGAAGAETSPTQLISFAIGEDQYGVDIMAVREIKGWTEITPLPRQPQYVRGVLNLRGVIVPIVDLRCRFGQGLTQATQIKPVPRVAQAQRLNYLSGLVTTEDAMIALIDLPNLLTLPVDEVGEESNAA
ncbi:MAG: chemotaxis protein CheW [Pseudolabrys sp.]